MLRFFKKKKSNSLPRTEPAPTYLRNSLPLDKTPYMYLFDTNVNIISIYDDKRYDRSDIDNLSAGMYRYITKKLTSIGFKQLTGRTFTHMQFDLNIEIPKARVQGASPFNCIDYTQKRPQDFYILTPTQTAAVIINTYEHQQAIDHIKALIQHQPINIFKLKDHTTQNIKHQQFLEAIPFLKYTQRKAVESDYLSKVKSLK